MNNTPLPAGIEPSLWEKIAQYLAPSFSPEMREWLWNFFKGIETFFALYGTWFWAGLVFLGIFFLGVSYFRRRQKMIEKLWHLILFFLSKRQMMIPLVFTFAQRDQLLSEKDLSTLLEIRALSRSVPLRKDPEKRMTIEKKVSQILFSFFDKMEKKENYPSQKTMKKIMKDFEFIDEKLVELQQVYNREALKWNLSRNKFPTKILASLFRFPSFKFFGNKIL